MRRAHVGEQHCDSSLRWLADAERKEIEPPAHRLGLILEANWLARAGHAPVGLEPVFLDRRYQVSYRPPYGIGNAGLLHERRVGLEKAVVGGPVVCVKEDLDDTEAHIDGVEQRAVLLFALP